MAAAEVEEVEVAAKVEVVEVAAREINSIRHDISTRRYP